MMASFIGPNYSLSSRNCVCTVMNEILSYLKQRLPESLQFLEQMVSMESPSFDKPLVDTFVRFVGSRFQEIGGDVDYVTAARFGDHMRARFGGKSKERVLLLG